MDNPLDVALICKIYNIKVDVQSLQYPRPVWGGINAFGPIDLSPSTQRH